MAFQRLRVYTQSSPGEAFHFLFRPRILSHAEVIFGDAGYACQQSDNVRVHHRSPGGAGRQSRNRASFVGPSSMWAPFMPAKPTLECGSSGYRLPLLIHTAIAPELEPERR
jgi:hypothetical protein